MTAARWFTDVKKRYSTAIENFRAKDALDSWFFLNSKVTA
jgi:hypothetical protein